MSILVNFLLTSLPGMHSIKDRPVVVNGQIVIRPIMVVALTYDHRLLDGREAVTFLGQSYPSESAYANANRPPVCSQGPRLPTRSSQNAPGIDVIIATAGTLPLTDMPPLINKHRFSWSCVARLSMLSRPTYNILVFNTGLCYRRVD